MATRAEDKRRTGFGHVTASLGMSRERDVTGTVEQAKRSPSDGTSAGFRRATPPRREAGDSAPCRWTGR